MRWLLLILVAILGLFQYWFWFGEGGLLQRSSLEKQVLEQGRENQALRERNAALEANVRYLKDGLEGIEERARHDLGMIKEGETFYMSIEKDSSQ
ncbi:cell division protein FtsB [Gammaproteobacteria bacterium 53_120_T64]|nr:cell division protein FtsB [Gammaproteobacteria bacterium 53_120_T64]